VRFLVSLAIAPGQVEAAPLGVDGAGLEDEEDLVRRARDRGLVLDSSDGPEGTSPVDHILIAIALDVLGPSKDREPPGSSVDVEILKLKKNVLI